ncbi:MAG: TIGR04076 family protein [Candidatus Ranarchaeia archaeon]
MSEHKKPPALNKYEVVVTVKEIRGVCNSHEVGDKLIYRDDQLFTDPEVGFCFGALQALSGVLPALAREVSSTDRDWLPNVTEQTCPDPKGKVIFEIKRRKIR